MPRIVLQFILDACGRRPRGQAVAGTIIGGVVVGGAIADGPMRPGLAGWFVLGGSIVGLLSAVLLLACESVRVPRSTSATRRAGYSVLAAAVVVALFAGVGFIAIMVWALLTAT